MNEFKEFVGVVGYGIEGFGVLVMVIGCTVATVRFVGALRGASMVDGCQTYRETLGREAA